MEYGTASPKGLVQNRTIIHASCNVFVNPARHDMEIIKILIKLMSNLGFQNINTFFMTMLPRDVFGS